MHGRGRAAHTGKTLDARLDLTAQRGKACATISGFDRRDAEEQEILSLESDVQRLKIQEGAEKEPPGRQQDDGKRHLRDHEATRQRKLRASRSPTWRVLLQSRRQVHTCRT